MMVVGDETLEGDGSHLGVPTCCQDFLISGHFCGNKSINCTLNKKKK
jgi:hypothetical protein